MGHSNKNNQLKLLAMAKIQKRKGSIILLFLLVIIFISSTSSALAIDTIPAQSNNLSLQNREKLNIRLEETKKTIGNLPEDTNATELESQYKATLQRHIVLLQEYIKQTDALRSLRTQDTDITKKIKNANRQLVELSSLAPVSPVAVPGKIDIVTLESDLSSARAQKSNLLNHQAQHQQLENEFASYLESANLRYQEAEQRENMLTKSKAQEQAQATLTLVNRQIENAQLDKLIAQQSKEIYEERRKWYRNNEPLIQVELEITEIRISRYEQQLTAYQQALQQQLEEQAKQAEETLLEKEKSVQEAVNPAARFIANWEAYIARSEKSISEYQALIVSLTAEAAEQEKQAILEKDEFLAIKHLLASQDNYSSSERIKMALLQIQQRSSLLSQSLREEKFSDLSQYRERSFAIVDNLFGLTGEFERLRDEVLSQLEAPEKQKFLTTSQELLITYRNTLRDEKTALTEVINQGQNLQLAMEQRLAKLNEFEHFIRSTSFWIRDARSLDWRTFIAIPRELLGNINKIREIASSEMVNRLYDAIRTPASFFYAAALFLVLPLGLYRLRTYLRDQYHRINDQVQTQGRLIQMAALVIFACLLSAALLPAYFFVVARIAESAQLPANLGNISSQLFDHLALFFFFWFLCRSFFAYRSIADVHFDLPRVAANSLYSALRWFLLGYLILLPWNILSQQPFNNTALPRVFYILFLVLSTIGVYQLTHPKSAFVQYQLAALNHDSITNNWKLASRLLVSVGGVSLGLNIAGYHYTSQSIVFSLAGTLSILALFPPLYRLLKWRILGFVNRRLKTSLEPDEKMPSRSDLKLNSLRIFKLASILLSFILLLHIWGVDEQAVQTLDDIQLYKVQITGAEPEFVTLGSFVRCVLFAFITFVIIRGLPSVLNIGVFPNWEVDVGVKYAISTISKYIAFIIGAFFIIAELYLDLSQLGWLMAAIGVGLGFGLQEIVSNFVSGLILLAERPVKPGDIVTIGNLTGTVSRINIRATTIVNFDRQEVMVPNRNLITNEVINWTRSDTVNRVVIAIGVAYGSNVNFVSDLLMKIATEQPKVLTVPEPTVIFMQHGESSLDLELRVFVSSPEDIMPTRDLLNRQISKIFAEENIEIPFPQRDLHIKSGSLVND